MGRGLLMFAGRGVKCVCVRGDPAPSPRQVAGSLEFRVQAVTESGLLLGTDDCPSLELSYDSRH